MNCSGAIAPSVDFTTETLYIVICYSIVFFFAFVGNAVMFLILFRNQCQKRRRVHLLLLHMTVAHLLVTMVYMPKEIIHNITVGWWGGDMLCRICKFFDVFGVALSAAILMCLSLDRFYSILFPLYVINAKKSVTRMLTVAWCVSIFTSLPQIYIFRAAQHPCFNWYTQCVSADVIGQISPKVTFWFSLLNILQVYFLPLIVILICYGSILISISLKTQTAYGNSVGNTPQQRQRNTTTTTTAATTAAASSTSAFLTQNRVKTSPSIGVSSRLSIASERCSEKSADAPYASDDGVRSVTAVSKSNSISVATTDAVLRRTGGEDSFQRAKNRTLKMTVVLVFAFLLCWTPYTVAMFIHFLSASQRIIPSLLRKFLYAFAVFNSAISPYLYGYFSFDIWEELRLLLLYFCSPNCFSKWGCIKLWKGSSENSASKRHAIRVKTELSSSTILPPTTTISGSSIRRKPSQFLHQMHQQQYQQQYQQQERKTSRACGGGGVTNNNNAAMTVVSAADRGGGGKFMLPDRIIPQQQHNYHPQPQSLTFRISKGFSLDETTTQVSALQNEELIKYAIRSEVASTTEIIEVDGSKEERRTLASKSKAKNNFNNKKSPAESLVISNGAILSDVIAHNGALSRNDAVDNRGVKTSAAPSSDVDYYCHKSLLTKNASVNNNNNKIDYHSNVKLKDGGGNCKDESRRPLLDAKPKKNRNGVGGVGGNVSFEEQANEYNCGDECATPTSRT